MLAAPRSKLGENPNWHVGAVTLGSNVTSILVEYCKTIGVKTE